MPGNAFLCMGHLSHAGQERRYWVFLPKGMMAVELGDP